jgi:hypothetical protein
MSMKSNQCSSTPLPRTKFTVGLQLSGDNGCMLLTGFRHYTVLGLRANPSWVLLQTLT